ncbi:MAG: ion transporter [Gammaproteobacteria bacterium]|nr:ion transporter [Gammaproteobacteria bacterium]
MELRRRLYVIIFGTDTRAGKLFDLTLLGLILFSFSVAVLDSVAEYSDQWHQLFFALEVCFSIFFAIEYATRIWVSPNRKQYIFSLYGIIDFLSLLPILFLWVDPNSAHLVVIRLLRVLRLFRILRLTEFLINENMLLKALKASSRMIFIFFLLVGMLATVYGALMYVIEGPENGFDSIPTGIYWAVVTITTVGYGDVTPHTVLGQSLATITMLTGYSIIAVPTGVFTASLAEQLKSRERIDTNCPHCGRFGHERDADFCKFCGASLEAKRQKTREELSE